MIELHGIAGSGLAERAELLRNLGQFENAINLLRSGAPEIGSSPTAAWTLRWAKAGDADVKTFTNVPAVWRDVENPTTNPDASPAQDQNDPRPKHVW